MADVFISYASEDRERARRLAEALAGRGWSVWWDRRILPGETFESVIERELASADCVLVLWSAASVGSHWTKAEADEALSRGVLVPALIDDVRIPIAFRHVQAASLVDWTPAARGHAGFEMLVESIRRLDRPDPPASTPPHPSAPASRAAAPIPLYAGAGAAQDRPGAPRAKAGAGARPRGRRGLAIGGVAVVGVLGLIAANTMGGGGDFDTYDPIDPKDTTTDASPSALVSREADAMAAGYQTVIGWSEEWVAASDTAEVALYAEPGYTYYVYARTTTDCDVDIYINDGVQDLRLDADATVEFFVDSSSQITVWFPMLSSTSTTCLMGRGIYAGPRTG